LSERESKKSVLHNDSDSDILNDVMDDQLENSNILDGFQNLVH
jgi:hypothetical protein